MTNNKSLDYNALLSELKTKRVEVSRELAELDKAIGIVENLANIGSFTSNNQQHTLFQEPRKAKVNGLDLSNMGIYEGAVALLDKRGEKMKTNDIIEGLIKHGKKIGSENVYNTVAAILHRASKTDNAKIKALGDGWWSLNN